MSYRTTAEAPHQESPAPQLDRKLYVLGARCHAKELAIREWLTTNPSRTMRDVKRIPTAQQALGLRPTSHDTIMDCDCRMQATSDLLYEIERSTSAHSGDRPNWITVR